jgi:ATP-dependent DNA helicase RecQ
MSDQRDEQQDELQGALKQHFGFEDFRPGQREIVERVLEGRDVLAVMPTGSGKSLCYQFPACILEGTTLVVSPLIALMKDQVDALRDFGVAATLINSSIGFQEQQARMLEMARGAYRIVYVAPERFQNDNFLNAIRDTDVDLLAVDEAHCISQWGHDFRPDYLKLGDVREMLGGPPTIALTATATNLVQRDIVDSLGMPNAEVVVSGFERPNLFYEVYVAGGDEDKLSRIEKVVEHWRGESVVVYCATRRQVDEVTRGLQQGGCVVGTYHGGMSDRQRARVQEAFMEGDVPVLVATNAFGMGVDKPDVRAIVHYNIPGSLEAYYQEAGRAGRDDEPADCVVLYNRRDRGIHDFFIENSFPEKEVVESVWMFLYKKGVDTHQIGAEEIADKIGRSGRKNVHNWAVETSLRLLKEGGHVDFGVRDGYPWVAVLDRARLRDLRVDWDRLKEQRDLGLRQLSDVETYATGQGCRQTYLLNYFNSSPSYEDGCGHCDNCVGQPEYARQSGRTVVSLETQDSADIVVRKVLSGIARAKARADAQTIAAMLRGSRASDVRRNGLASLSTHGILDYFNQQDLVELIERCVGAELVAEGRSSLELTDAGASVMKGDTSVPVEITRILERHLIDD